jgi:hypothetical protein
VYALLVTDFATIEKAVGPFADREAARRWAEENAMGELYRIVEITPPADTSVVVRRLMDLDT